MQSVRYGTKTIEFQIRRARRKTLAIEVHPDSTVILIAPEETSIEDLKAKVIKRAKWIVKQQEYFEQFLPHTPSRDYVSGETHYYLGRRYILKVISENSNAVKLKAGQIMVYTTNPSPSKVKSLLAAWYYNHAKNKFETVLQEVKPKFQQDDISIGDLQIQRMKKRWGSCTSNGKITLNPELIKAPTKCIEYVIIHELCHIKVPNHSKAFYNLLEEKLPNWEKWKMRLEKIMV